MSVSSSSCDLLIVGGGPAGLATSIFAAQKGLDVTLIERGALPLDKPCGEGLMPEGVRLLDTMGLTLPRSHAIDGIRYIDESIGAVEGRFVSGTGLGVRRCELSRVMVRRARALGVRVQERRRVQKVRYERTRVVIELDADTYEAPFLVAADGLNSQLRRDAGLERARRRSRLVRYGFRRHYRIPPWSSFVEVYWGLGAEAYVTPVGPDEVGVALLWHEPAPSFEAMLARFPALAARLVGAPVSTALKGAGPFRQGARHVHKGRLALVGDAAGYLDAITGEGVALGFQSAHAVVRALTSGQGLSSYAVAHRRLRRRHVVLTELALALAARPRLRRRVIGAMCRHPRIFNHLVAVAAYAEPPREQLRLNLHAPAGTLDLS